MATKLKDLEITSVDFVPKGANQRADILIQKNDKSEGEAVGILKKLAKAFGSVFAEDGPVKKSDDDAKTFTEVIGEQAIYGICDEMWGVLYALKDSFYSILADDNVKNKDVLMQASLAEFNEAVNGYIQTWATGKTVGIAKVDKGKDCGKCGTKKDDDNDEGEKPKDVNVGDGDTEEKCDGKKTTKGDNEMNIDKSKLTPEELDFLAKIEAKAGVVAEAATQDNTPAPTANPVVPEPVVPADDGGEVAKIDTEGVLSRFENIMKALDDTVAKIEDDKLTELAKKYAVLGMKPEELVPFFKEIKKDSAVYDSVIKKFDAAVEAVNKSGVFAEVGKRGMEDDGDVVEKIAKHATEIMKSNPGIDRVKAEQMAWEQHPELVAQYESQI